MKLLIIDNEAAIRKTIRETLELFCPEVTKIEEATGVQSGLNTIDSFQPDVVLLDVEMDDGTGFDLMKKIHYPDFQLIFITAHNKYAIDAFRFSAIDYLLKPVNAGDLQEAIQRASFHLKNRNLNHQLEILLHQIGERKVVDRKIALRDSETIFFVRLSEILYCMAEGVYTNFFLQPTGKIIISKPLKEYETLLEPDGFIRTHHSYLVNSDKIIRYDKGDGGSLILEGNISIPLSQRKKETILNLLENKR